MDIPVRSFQSDNTHLAQIADIIHSHCLSTVSVLYVLLFVSMPHQCSCTLYLYLCHTVSIGTIFMCVYHDCACVYYICVYVIPMSVCTVFVYVPYQRLCTVYQYLCTVSVPRHWPESCSISSPFPWSLFYLVFVCLTCHNHMSGYHTGVCISHHYLSISLVSMYHSSVCVPMTL